MTRQYNPKTFLREASNPLIKQYLARFSITPVDWNEHKETDVQPVLDAIKAAASPVQDQIDADFLKISALANEHGIMSLRRIAEEREFEIELDDKLSTLDQCLYAFLYSEDLFYEAEIIEEADTRRSTKRPLPKLEIDTSDEALDALRLALRDYYASNQGRGRGCDIDYRYRNGKHYFTCKLSDYAETHTTFDENEALQVDTHRPVFDVLFVYDPAGPELETTVNGGKRVRDAVEDLLGQHILGVNMLGSPTRAPRFKLQQLFSLTPLPIEGDGDGIASVTLRGITLVLFGSKSVAVTLRTEPTDVPDAIYTLIKRVLSAELLAAPNQISVSRAEFRAVFDPDEHGRSKSRMFTISNPDHYAGIGNDPLADVLRAYLKRWGIDVTGTAECSADGDGYAVQHVIRPR